jgi:hypothetical protein
VNGKESADPGGQGKYPAAQQQQHEAPAVQPAGMAMEDTPKLLAQRRRIEGAFGPRPGAAAVQRIIQLKKFDFDGHSIDSERLDEFVNFCTGMARVNPERLASLVPFLLDKAPGLRHEDVIQMCRLIWMAQGRAVPAVDRTIAAGFQAIIDAAGRLGAGDMVSRTVRNAAIIDANADLITLAGPKARIFVMHLVGEQPEYGFDNESAGAIRQRTRVLPTVWGTLAGDPQRVNFFSNGFGNDPCICGRLNSVTEFLAKQSIGVSDEELSGKKYDEALTGQIAKLIYAFFKGQDDQDDFVPDWNAFRVHFLANHAHLTAHPKFHASYAMAKLATYDA